MSEERPKKEEEQPASGGPQEHPHSRRPEGHQEKPAEPGLNEQGEATATLLRKALKALDAQVDGREDEPVVMVAAQDIQRACQICKDDPDLDFKFLRCLSVVDYGEHLQVVYHLYSYTRRHKAVLKASVPTDEPRLPSVVSVWRGADWYEREGHDLFGVVFEGHPNLAPLLLYEGFEGYPGRKSFPFHNYEEW